MTYYTAILYYTILYRCEAYTYVIYTLLDTDLLL